MNKSEQYVYRNANRLIDVLPVAKQISIFCP
jgi:hypothetical protein